MRRQGALHNRYDRGGGVLGCSRIRVQGPPESSSAWCRCSMVTDSDPAGRPKVVVLGVGTLIRLHPNTLPLCP